jgi:hypothetical protein
MMKKFFLFVVVWALCAGCRPNVLKGDALKSKLMETMSDYMNKNPSDTAHKFIVKDVVFFPRKDKNFYDCTFTVEMQSKDKDTTGVMTAEITNDFKKVFRIQ